MFSSLVYLTNICHGYLSCYGNDTLAQTLVTCQVSRQVSAHVTLVKGMTNVCLLIQLKIVVAFPQVI